MPVNWILGHNPQQRDVCESLKYCSNLWLSSMLDCIHICVFLFFEKLFLSNIDNFSISLDR